MSDVSRGFSLISPTMAFLLFFVIMGAISVGDVVLSILFVLLAFTVLGIPWQHRSWLPQANVKHERARKLLAGVYIASVVIIATMPVLSLSTAYLLRVYAPNYINQSFAGIIKHPPATVTVETITLNSPMDKGSEPYVAMFENASQNITAAQPSLREILSDIDYRVRQTGAWYGFGVALLLLFVVGIGETLAAMNISEQNELAPNPSETIVTEQVSSRPESSATAKNSRPLGH